MVFIEKEFDAVIFDMDGTMFNTERLRMDMLKKASSEIYGEEISDEFLYNALGLSAATSETMAKSKYGADFPYMEIRRRADQLEIAHVRTNGVPVKDGLYNLMERFKKNNIFIALATSSRREIAEEYLINAKVFRYFDILVCGDDVKKGKPDPEIFTRAATELSCPPEKCLILEDSQNGLLAASAAGGIPIFIKDIKEPDPEVKALAYKSYGSMPEFLQDFIPFTPKLPVPQLNEYYPQSEDNVIAGIHGFGAIGGGYLAPIFSHWDGYTRPKEIIGATRNPLIINAVNSLGRYRIRYESKAYFQTVSQIRLIDIASEPDMLDMYKRSAIIGLALPEKIIHAQAGVIAKGLAGRYAAGGEDLTILIVMNKVDAAQFVKKQVRNALKNLVGPEAAKPILDRTSFIETVVNRMVSAIPEDKIISKLKNDLYFLRSKLDQINKDIENIQGFFEYYKKANVKRPRKHSVQTEKEAPRISISESLASFSSLAAIGEDINLTLFSSEPDMSLYAAQGSAVAARLRQVVIDDIKSMQEIKNKLSNGPHAIIAWYSQLLGYSTIGQGMGDQRIEALVRNIMEEEIRPALLHKYPKYGQYMNTFIRNFIKRCRNSFQDKCARVGRDCLRKLQNDERIMGTIRMAAEYDIATEGLEFGAACAILTCILNKNPLDAEAKTVRALYEKNKSVADVLAYDGIYNKETYKGLDSCGDQALLQRIQERFDELKEAFL